MGSTLKTTPEQSGSSAAKSRAGPHVMSGRHLHSGQQTDNTHKIISNLNRIEINFRINDFDSNFRMSDKVLNQIDEAMKDMAGDKPPDEHPDENEMALEYPEDDILMVDEGHQEDEEDNDRWRKLVPEMKSLLGLRATSDMLTFMTSGKVMAWSKS